MPWINGHWEPEPNQTAPPAEWHSTQLDSMMSSFAASIMSQDMMKRVRAATPKKEEKVEKVDCHGCGRIYSRTDMAYISEEHKIKLCAACLPQYITCGHCGGTKDIATWVPSLPINKQCDDCGSPSHGLAVKQHRTFKPQSNLIKTRRDTLWPKQQPPQSPSLDSVPTPKWQSF